MWGGRSRSLSMVFGTCATRMRPLARSSSFMAEKAVSSPPIVTSCDTSSRSKAARLDCPVQHASAQPHAAGDVCGPAKAQPEIQTDQEAEQRQHEILQSPLFSAHPVMRERGEVDAHEGDERAEVQHLGAELIG